MQNRFLNAPKQIRRKSHCLINPLSILFPDPQQISTMESYRIYHVSFHPSRLLSPILRQMERYVQFAVVRHDFLRCAHAERNNGQKVTPCLNRLGQNHTETRLDHLGNFERRVEVHFNDAPLRRVKSQRQTCAPKPASASRHKRRMCHCLRASASDRQRN